MPDVNVTQELAQPIEVEIGVQADVQVAVVSEQAVDVDVGAGNVLVDTGVAVTEINVEVGSGIPINVTMEAVGPAGQSSEDLVPVQKEIDWAPDGLTVYLGEAPPGTPTSDAGWRIRRRIFNSEGDYSEKYADGDANYDNVWDDRATTVVYLPV